MKRKGNIAETDELGAIVLDESCEQYGNRYNYFLSNQDRANGFVIETDQYNNVTLLKQGKAVACFSRITSEEAVKAFVELIKDFELRVNSQSLSSAPNSRN